MKVLFVCSGNICRSAIAARLMRRQAKVSRCGFDVDSAGTLGIKGASASDEAIQAMGEIGLDLSDHLSQGIGAKHLGDADVIIAMTHAHLSELAAKFPRVRTPRFVLRAFENGPKPDLAAPDLEDPIGCPVEIYREQIVVIRRCLEHLATYLERVG